MNAPADVRDFSFVLNESEHKKFSVALNVWSGGKPDPTDKERGDATDFLLNAPRQEGSLSILHIELGGLEKGVRPRFESMKFDVTLCFPPSGASPQEKGKAVRPGAPNKNPRTLPFLHAHLM